MAATDPLALRSEDDFLKDVREAYEQDISTDRNNRDEAAKDLKFRTGEQWDETVLQLRKGRPSLVLNRMPQFVRQVTGDIRMNKPAAKVTPVDSGADPATAEVIEGLLRHIEYQSQAGRIYSIVADAQVTAGMGHMRLVIEWPDDGFEPELVIRGIRNPFAVVWDHSAEQPDRSDAQHCFVEQRITKAKFEKAFPDATTSSFPITIPSALRDWITADMVRVAEYWCVHKVSTTLLLLNNGVVLEDDQSDSFRMAAEQVGVLKERTVQRPQIVQYLTNGHKLLGEPYIWPGRKIPIFTAWGEEVCLGEKIFRHGLIRFGRDPQFLINNFMSAAVETLALQPRPKWLAHSDAIKGHEAKYRDANVSKDALLPYTGATAPKFVEPPEFPAAFVQMAAIAEDSMKATIGIYDAGLGARSNETSGKAIVARQREGDVSTFVYTDNLNWAIESLLKEAVAVAPHTYDTPREIRVLGEDMQAKVIAVNQAGGQFDLRRGKYDVRITTGPSFTTRRQEASEGMISLIQAFPQSAQVLAPFIARNQDWPQADEVAQAMLKISQAPPPPPNPKDEAQAEKYAAEAEGQKLQNIADAVQLGRVMGPVAGPMGAAMTNGFASPPPAGGQAPPPERPGAPGASPGPSVATEAM